MEPLLSVTGELVGLRLSPESGKVAAEVVHVTSEQRPSGPAENAFLLVELSNSGSRARYISWINYFDLDYASAKQQGRWRLVEPPEPYERTLSWSPFGWPGACPVPTIGDSVLQQNGHQESIEVICR